MYIVDIKICNYVIICFVHKILYLQLGFISKDQVQVPSCFYVIFSSVQTMPEHSILKHHQQPLVCSCSIMKETMFFLVKKKKHRRVDPHLTKLCTGHTRLWIVVPWPAITLVTWLFKANRCRGWKWSWGAGVSKIIATVDGSWWHGKWRP